MLCKSRKNLYVSSGRFGDLNCSIARFTTYWLLLGVRQMTQQARNQLQSACVLRRLCGLMPTRLGLNAAVLCRIPDLPVQQGQVGDFKIVRKCANVVQYQALPRRRISVFMLW